MVATIARCEPPSSRGLGRRPLTAETGVRIPVAVPGKAPQTAGFSSSTGRVAQALAQAVRFRCLVPGVRSEAVVIVVPTQSNRGRLRSLWTRSRPAAIAAVIVGGVLWALPYAVIGGAAITAAVVGSNLTLRCLLLAGCIAIAGVLVERFLRRRVDFWLPVRAWLDRYQTREWSQGGKVVIEFAVAADKADARKGRATGPRLLR
jgi:hypothetical protein